MVYQASLVNDEGISQPPLASVPAKRPSLSVHPLGFSCTLCRARHIGCDRAKPACGECRKTGQEAKCSYPEILPADVETLGNKITKTAGAPFSGPMPTNQSTHPLGFSCIVCRARHVGCDRSKPACGECRKTDQEAKCSYPEILPAEVETLGNKITKTAGAPSSAPMPINKPTPLSVGEKHPRGSVTSKDGRVSMIDILGKLINADPRDAPQLQTSQRPPAKRQKINEVDPGLGVGQSHQTSGQVSSIGTEIRCNLTTEINVQRLRSRVLSGACLRGIIKLLKKAKSGRSSVEAESSQLEEDWLEEDDMMEYAATKLEKGGSCSRAILTRFEHFLYGPLMSAEEKKTQERIICIEECLSCSSSQPTTHHNEIFLRRLEKIIVNPPAFDLSANHPHIQELRQELDTARSVNSKLRPATCRKFAKFLNPEGEIVVNFNPSLDSRRPNAETSSSPRKERSIAESSRVPSSQNRHTLSETTATPLRDIFSSLVPSSHYPPPSALSSSSLSSVPTSPQSTVDSIDLFEDIMASFTPSKRQKKRPASRGEMPPPGYNARVSTAVWGSSQEPAVSGRKSSISGDKALEALVPTVPGTQSSTVNNNGAAALMPPTSGIQPSDKHNNNSTALIPSGATSGAQLLPSEVPKRLLTIFLAKQSAILPILDIDQIKAGLNVAVDHGLIKPNNVNPTIALCLAIACHLTRDQNLWGSQKWYDAAVSKLPAIEKSEHSLSYFNRRILQTEYLHIVGNLNKAWAVLSMTIGEAEMLKMQTPHGGCLVVGQKSLEQVRLVWQCLWTKKLLLALQLGITTQSFDMFDDPPMPLRSHIENNMSPDGVTSNELRLATSSFFFACSSLFKLADDLILLEKTLRAKRAECPMKWLSTAELCGFYEMHGNLTRWREELHESLKWNGPGIGLEMKDPLIRRMCVLAHMRFVYFRLRQYRPFFILTLRLSLSCVCKSGPHISFKNIDDPESHPAFGTIYYSATKCLSAAQDIVKTTRSVFEKEMDELSNSEFLDYLYAAALILIAARAAPFLAKGTMSGISASSTISKSFTTMTNNIQHVDRILRMYEENCEQSPELKHRIECARSALSSIGLQCLSSGHVISDKNLNFAPIVWQSIYSRIGVEFLFKKYPNDANVLVRGRESTFGWLESLPFDMET